MANLFRFRVLIFLLLYVLGFLAPWERLFGGAEGTVWLDATTQLARTGLLGLANATLIATLASLACLTLGAILRVWGTAYLGFATMQGTALQGDAIVAAGPYAHLRNPLYVGSWLLAIGTSILMPLTGAIFFLLAFTAFTLTLIFGEERYLAATAGLPYEQYRRQVPRLLPRFRGATKLPVRPRWLQALIAETYPVLFTVLFGVFAWRYNARVLIQCLLISYGLSLVVRASLKQS